MDEEWEQETSFVTRQYADEGETPEQYYIAKEEYREVLEAMARLSREHKAMVILRDMEGFSYGEIAEITKLSMGTVKSRIARARNQLKHEMIKRRERNGKMFRQNREKEGKPHEM